MDTQYMKMAMDLAKLGCGYVSPNPMVGAVIVKNNKIIGKGYHKSYGELHAERAALEACTESPEDAELYVTLEPCCHHGKQPPCTEAIIASGIKHVIVGSPDPNPLVAGKGISILKKHGIKVTEDILRAECDELNYVFLYYIRTRFPYVVMKYAMTMDGKTATVTGASRWITGETSRKHVHEDRHRYSAIMIGIGTLLADDPFLTCRLPEGKNPVRIICDSRLKIPLTSQIIQTAKQVPTIIATCDIEKNKNADNENKKSILKQYGCEVITLPHKNGHVNLNELMKVLGEKKIDSILLEGGGTLNWAALESGIVNRVQTYIAPKLFGGRTAPSPVSGIGVNIPNKGIPLSKPTITYMNEDILLESEVKKCSQE